MSKGLQSGQLISVDCKTCSGCITRYQNSLIGACLSETAHAQHAVRFDMTYANDAGSNTRSDLAHVMFKADHIRQFTERMRTLRGFGRCRYLVAGEYGPLRGRAHFHSVLIFEDGMPEFDFSSARYNDNRLWPFGFVSARPITDASAIAYAVKYAVKSTKALKEHSGYLPGVETFMRRSRIPPLGQPFLLEHATKLAEYAIPLSMRYMPPGGIPKANYHVRGKAVRSRMAHAYLDQLELMGFDTNYFEWVPHGYQFKGPQIPRSSDPDLARLLEEVVRLRRLDAIPDKTSLQEKRAMRAEFREREAKQERINALEAEQREAAKVRRAKARNDAFSAHFSHDVGSDDWLNYDDAIADQLLGSARRRLRGS